MIRGPNGRTVKILRIADAADYREMEDEEPDEYDRAAILNAAYIVVQEDGTGVVSIENRALLKADNGTKEITAIIEACKANGGIAP